MLLCFDEGYDRVVETLGFPHLELLSPIASWIHSRYLVILVVMTKISLSESCTHCLHVEDLHNALEI